MMVDKNQIMQDYRNLLKSYAQVYKNSDNSFQLQINVLLSDYLKHRKACYDAKRSRAPDFNPIKLLGIEDDELKHSTILAWLLDPSGSHNQGNIFFKHFLLCFGYKVSFSEKDYKVKQEFRMKESTIDILAYGKDFIFWIENKTGTQEGCDQTNREYRDLERFSKMLGISENKFPIFLTPTGEKPKNKNFKDVSYKKLSQAIINSVNEIQSEYVKYFVVSWICVLKNIGGS